MGFDLWTDDELAWARGTYEYRPLGAAVIAATDLFRRRDFHPRNGPPREPAVYAGQFASLGQMNQWLQARRGGLTPVRRGATVVAKTNSGGRRAGRDPSH